MGFWEFLDKHIAFASFVVVMIALVLPSVSYTRNIREKGGK